MAGIYLHIPFCKQACYYCDFHFSTNSSYTDAMVAAMAKELKLQQHYLSEAEVNTIYFGGGTPSLLSKDQITLLLNEIYQHYPIGADPEITLEANPDDLSRDKLTQLKACGINRLSIGVQSFDDVQLAFMNRAHTAKEALQSINDARTLGFDNITIDLIYGIPNSSLNDWASNLAQAVALKVPHISAYCLTIEPGTVFGHRQQKKQLTPLQEDVTAEQFELLVKTLDENGYDHYEVSNFCLPGMHSRHNSNYWKFQKYLGVGPSAHSFDLSTRQFNIKNNHLYISKIDQDIIPCQVESLTDKDKANEYLLTSLRTSWGCDLHFLKDRFNIDLLKSQSEKLNDYLEKKLIVKSNNVIFLTTHGRLVADKIIEDFFIL
ncbi:radical SAM family heme chaperone HemW [Fulvivirgaceae bacterium BMA12]|uniref:Heme chaperone HemW n=1 Tax=Agaribacillus aureus TaxID=3051825 RepID=A0ABT8LFI0_9BACT|nr:radical SAM family heme chaperone HemW [Fulvivirgaceae bacterium BMA12]